MVQSTVVPKGYMALELFFVQVSARTNKRHHHLHTNTMRGKYKKKLKQRKTSHQMHTATQRQERPCQAAPTPSFAATSAPWSSSVCTTARCPPREAACKLVLPSWRAGVRSAAGPQRQERPRQAATLSRAGHPALLTARCCLGTATQMRTIACSHHHAYFGAHKHGVLAHARAATPTPAARPRADSRGLFHSRQRPP